MNNFAKNLKEIIQEIQVQKGFSRDKFFEGCINEKLKNIVARYNLDLDLGTNFLLTRSSESVIKAINKIQKVKDREVLRSYMNNKRSKKENYPGKKKSEAPYCLKPICQKEKRIKHLLLFKPFQNQ